MSNRDRSTMGSRADASIVRRPKARSGIVFRNTVFTRCIAGLPVLDLDRVRHVIERSNVDLALVPGSKYYLVKDRPRKLPVKFVDGLWARLSPAFRQELERAFPSLDHRVLWEDLSRNLVVNTGLDHILDIEFAAGTQVTAWFVTLTDGTPTVVAGDTYQSHAGWVEVTAYSEATRQAWTEVNTGTGQLDNSAATADFSINADTTTIGGAGIVSDNTKGDSGAGPFLYSAVAFTTGDKLADNGDTLQVTYTITVADDAV